MAWPRGGSSVHVDVTMCGVLVWDLGQLFYMLTWGWPSLWLMYMVLLLTESPSGIDSHRVPL